MKCQGKSVVGRPREIEMPVRATMIMESRDIERLRKVSERLGSPMSRLMRDVVIEWLDDEQAVGA